MNRDELILNALNELVIDKTRNGAYGLVIIGVPEIPIKKLLFSFNNPENTYVSLIGSTENEDSLIEWCNEYGWDEYRLGFNATHAVDVRNEAPDDSIKLAFVWEEEERLHSLIQRGYQYIGPTELIKQICIFGANNAQNDPQKNLWKSLSSDRVSAYISLEGITEYYLKLFGDENVENVNETDKPRKFLTLLNLLPDKELLTKKYINKYEIINRIIQNAKMVEQIQRADEEDRQDAIKTIKQNADNPEKKSKLQVIYNAYLRLTRSDYTALSEMELSDAIFLLSGKGKSPTAGNTGTRGGENCGDDPNGGGGFPPTGNGTGGDGDDDDYTPDGEGNTGNGSNGTSRDVKPFKSLSNAAIKLISQSEGSVLKKLIDEASRLLSEGQYDKKEIVINHERLTVRVKFNPDQSAVSINKNFVQNGRMGGKINAKDINFDVILDNFGRYIDKSEYFDDVNVRTLLEFMGRARDLSSDFSGEELLREYINSRANLMEFADLLAVSPLALLIAYDGARKAAEESISKYQNLLAHLDEHYAKLHRESPEGAEYIYKEILALDTIKIVSENEVSVLLTGLNPLVIWKYVELANLVLEDDSDLSTNDIDLLEVDNLPEPLLAIYSPGLNKNYEQLGFSTCIGSLPLYRSISVEMSDLSQKSIGTAAVKLASLYPPIKQNLRILLVNPLTTIPTSKTIKDLISDKYGFKKATLIVAKTGKQKSAIELPFDPVLKELVYENKADIEVLRIRNSDQLQKYLSKKPVHLMGISGEKTKNVSLIESEGTRLHPLSVPHKIHPDPLMGTITLKPRSIQNSEDGVKHPFGIYHKIVSEVTGNYHSEFSMLEASATPINDVNSLLPFSLFVITIGHVPEIMEESDLIRLTQNVELSGDTVYTYHKDSIINGLSKHLKQFNYKPTTGGLMTLLRRLQAVGGEGLFTTITEKGKNGFSETALKGLLGLAVALNWYVNHSLEERSIVVSLDSYLSRRWLQKRKDNKRSDFLGIRQSKDGSYSIDILEVKSYEATNETDVLDSYAAEQLKSIAKIINNMVSHQGDLFTDRRRELLRLQIFREALQLGTKHDPNWIKALNSIIDGTLPVKINLVLLEVAFDQNIYITEQTFTPETTGETSEVYQLPIIRIRFGEEEIQKYLEGYVEKVTETEDSYQDDNFETEEQPNESSVEFEDNQNNNSEDSTEDLEFERNSNNEDNLDSDLKKDDSTDIGINNPEVRSEIELLLGKQVGWDKKIYWDHRRNIANPLSNHNIIITGDPGKGKTQTIKGLIHELRSNNIPLLTFDFKDDYIDPAFLENEGIEKFDVMVEGLPFNPLVPSIDPVEKTFIAITHIVHIEGILKRVYNLGVQQATQLRNALVEAFRRKGIQPNIPTKESDVHEYPTFQEVQEILYEDDRRNSTLIGRLDLLFQIGIFPNKPKMNFDQFMKGSYILRLSTLPDPDNEIKAAVAEIIILAVHNYLISKEHPRKLTRAIVLDEAHRVSQSRALLALMREGRAFGIGMLIATQFPTDIPQDIYGCTETKLFLGNDDFNHAEAAAKKLEGGSSRNNINALAEQVRNMKQFRSILRNSQYPNIFVDLIPYYKRL
ncbi:hypothetical protein [Bacillus sp. lyk4-R2A-2]|uniref:ATP-binding protein n=1 Tax=Bacillus sp. lyk4-R2A-2 TaxID=3040282 RepID=UPI00254F75CE|nr:hypothetical protein [Bacillus sp. lyk4-R2A-2]